MKIAKAPLLIFILTTQAFIFAQENDTAKRKTSIGFAFGADYNYRSLKTESGIYSIERNYVQTRNLSEIRKFGLNAEITLSQSLGKHFNIITGLYFREKGYLMQNSSWIDTAGISIIGESDINFQMSYIGIPLKFEYVQPFKRFSFFVNGGLGLDFMVRNQMKANIDYYWQEDAIEKHQRGERNLPWYPNSFETDANRFMVTGLFEFGLLVPLADRMQLRISPNGAFNLNSVLKEPISEKLWSVGLRFGMTFDL